MYRCLVDGELFHFPQANKRECALISGTVNTEMNRAGTFDFQIPPTNACYLGSKFKKLVSEIEVWWEAERLFRGRILDETRSFLGQINFKCEGWMSVLNDSVVVPKSVPSGWGDDEKGIHDVSVEAVFTWLITNHNAQVGADGFNVNKRFENIYVQGTFATKKPNFPWPNGEKTLDYIQSNFLSNDEIGGMMTVDSNAIYLKDMNDEDNKVNAIQDIMQGRNLLDLTQTIDATEVYTAIYPVGKDGLTLTGSGPITYNQKQYYQHDGMIEAPQSILTDFSRIVHYEDFSEAETQQALQNAALPLLEASCSIPTSIDVSAVDLNLVDSNIPRLQVGQAVKIMAPHYGMEIRYICTASTVDICNPANTKFTIGKTVDTMTTKQLALARNVKQSTLKYGAETSSKTLTINAYDSRVEINNRTLSFYKTNKTVYLNFTVTFLKVVTASSPTIMTFNKEYAPVSEVTGVAYDETTGDSYTMKVTSDTNNGLVQIMAYGDGIAVDDVVSGTLTWMVK